ncbi:unnamed protein product, partial [Lampetra fluviatilis]
RNQNYLDILRFLSLGDKRLSSFDITSRFTHLFWFGDLNYRLDMDVQEIMAHINKKEFDALLKVDQLNLEREKSKIFLRFNEEDISFPPTYRYERGTRDSYAWQKFKTTGVRVNVPSWCDRILWKSYPETHIVCNSYGCTDDIVTSDHSPVFATYEVGVTSQFVSKKGSADESHIELESVEAIVKTTSRTKFFLEFYSSCLEGPCKSGENDSQQSEVANFLKVGWSQLQLPLLKPMIADLEYLQDQHILLTVRSSDGYESYGECCLALKSMIGTTPQQFETFLSHRGEETGNVRGWMKVRVPSDRLATRERLYAWISIDNEDHVSTSKKKNPSPAMPGEPTDAAGSKAEAEPAPAKISIDNPNYFILFPGSPVPSIPTGAPPPVPPAPPAPPVAAGDVAHQAPASAPARADASADGAGSARLPTPAPRTRAGSRHGAGGAGGAAGENGDGGEEENGDGCPSPNRPPPDYPPPPLPGGEARGGGAAPLRGGPGAAAAAAVPAAATHDRDMLGLVADQLMFVSRAHPERAGGPPGLPRPPAETRPADDRSWFALQMAKSLYEGDAAGTAPRGPAGEAAPAPGGEGGGHRRSARGGSRAVGRWLGALGLEAYEAALVRNGWDDVDYLGDLTVDDLEEVGVADPEHQRLILLNLPAAPASDT